MCAAAFCYDLSANIGNSWFFSHFRGFLKADIFSIWSLIFYAPADIILLLMVHVNEKNRRAVHIVLWLSTV